MMPFPTDLFNEVPVTWPEVEHWCADLRISPERRDWYVQNWNVVWKIQQAKRDGTFYPVDDAVRQHRASR